MKIISFTIYICEEHRENHHLDSLRDSDPPTAQPKIVSLPRKADIGKSQSDSLSWPELHQSMCAPHPLKPWTVLIVESSQQNNNSNIWEYLVFPLLRWSLWLIVEIAGFGARAMLIPRLGRLKQLSTYEALDCLENHFGLRIESPNRDLHSTYTGNWIQAFWVAMSTNRSTFTNLKIAAESSV